MREFIIGIAAGSAVTLLIIFRRGFRFRWWHWLMAAVGLISILFSLDVLIGSLNENERRAAFLGFALFFAPGAGLLGLSLIQARRARLGKKM